MPLALLHGLLAANGSVLLIAAALTQPGFGTLAVASLVIFALAALGGFYLFSHHLRGRPLPSTVVLIDGGAAVVAFLLLLGRPLHQHAVGRRSRRAGSARRA